jgi:hypothetical protein
MMIALNSELLDPFKILNELVLVVPDVVWEKLVLDFVPCLGRPETRRFVLLRFPLLLPLILSPAAGAGFIDLGVLHHGVIAST